MGFDALDHENAVFSSIVLIFSLFFLGGEGHNPVSVGREGSGKAKSSMGDNLLADGRKGDPQLYAEGKNLFNCSVCF